MSEQYGCAQTRSSKRIRAVLGLTLLAATCSALLSGCAGYTSAKAAEANTATALTISSVATTGATPSGVSISWQTSEQATSQVEYGTTTAYGSTTALITTMVSNHQQALSNLSSATLYHFRVMSTDADNNSTDSADQTFSTTSAGTNSTPPSVSITSPLAGATLVGTVQVTANASDSVGVSSVQFMLDGANVGSPVTAAPYVTSWDTTTASNGQHMLSAVAQDTAGNGATSAGVSVTVANTAAPAITSQPASQTVTAGQAATFMVAASGTAPLAYQWQKNGVNITGATSSSYTTPTATLADNGSAFTVTVSNGTLPNATSGAAILTVTAIAVAPSITSQPVSQTVTAGQTATFTVVANGTAPLNYQWQKNGANITGATGSSYTTPATTITDSGSAFTVTVSNGTLPNATSSAATLTVNAASVAPTILTQPVSQTVTAGQTATFTVAANGTAPLSYQWRKNGVNITGATGTSYTTPATTTADNGSTFSVVVSNGTSPNATSSSATLTVTAAALAPSITSQPVSQTVTAGQTATFTVVAGGSAPLSYQWQKNGVNIAGATGSSYTTPATTTADSGSTFTVTVSNGTLPNATSNAATLTVNAAVVAPTILTQPVSQSVTAGQTATFTVSANGTAPLNYQWRKNGANITGATGTSYTTPATTTADNGSTFSVVVSNGTSPNATSSSATLTVTAAPVAPSITSQPVSQTVTAGQTATFTVVAGGTAPLAYQWQKNGVNITGGTGSSYTTPATTTGDSGSTFTVTVSNGTLPNATSNAATLTVNAALVAPSITSQPVSQTVTAGQTATFTVAASGTAPLTYQWRENGTNITGATGTSYTTPATTTANSGSTFSVVVSNGTLPNATSNSATLTVNAPAAPAISTNPTSVTFTSTVVGNSASQPVIISNPGTAMLTITAVSASGTGFSVSGFSLPININAGQQTTITAAFQPTGTGQSTGAISITSNAPSSPTSIGLTGTGAAATQTLGISPTSLSFGNVPDNTSSTTQTVTITNTGNSNVAVSAVAISGTGFSMTGGSTGTLAPGQNITLTVQFSPTSAGSASGSITVTSNATGSPASIGLSGTGTHWVALAWQASPSTVAGYYVYRSTVSGSGFAKVFSSPLAALTYSDSNVTAGTTYYYEVTAVDASGNESVASNQASALVP